MHFSSYLLWFRSPHSLIGSNWDCSEATHSNSVCFSLESVFNLLKAACQDVLCNPCWPAYFSLSVFNPDLCPQLVEWDIPKIWPPSPLPPRLPGMIMWQSSIKRWCFGCIWPTKNKKRKEKSCFFQSLSYSRTPTVSTSPPPKTPIWARPVYVKDKQPAVKSVFSVVRLFATRTQRKGNLVEQTHRVLDLVDDLQAGFSGRHSHSAYIHLHLLKTPGRARPVITGTFPVVVSVWLEGIRCLHYWCGFWFSHVRSL